MTRLASVLSFSSAALASWLYVKPKTRGLSSNMIGYGLKIVGAALAPVIGLMGLVGAMLARHSDRSATGFLGALGALMAAGFIQNVAAPHHGFAQTYGPGWERKAVSGAAQRTPSLPNLTMQAPQRRARVRTTGMLAHRWQWGQVTVHPKPHMIQNLTYATVPDRDRPLLCDLWLPDLSSDDSLPQSGMGIIYLHGGAWQAFNKDVMTRPFFRHLCTQGHVVMDVAYRLARETDMRGMLGDVKRAVAWLKQEGPRLGVHPNKIVLAGGSAGGHLALLAAYTPNDTDFDPPDVQATDTAVCGVVAYYPVADLRTLVDHWSEQAMHPLATALGRGLGYFPREGYLPWSELVQQLFDMPLTAGEALTQQLLAFSPMAHVGSRCPPTLFLQGLHDHVIPVQDVQALHKALVAAGRPSVLVELPQVEHAFDMIALQVSPPAQAALYDVERFLALLV